MVKSALVSVLVSVLVSALVSVLVSGVFSTATDLSTLEDQEDDTEYNFWAEKHDYHEKEEFRTDRGVKIPRK